MLVLLSLSHIIVQSKHNQTLLKIIPSSIVLVLFPSSPPPTFPSSFQCLQNYKLKRGSSQLPQSQKKKKKKVVLLGTNADRASPNLLFLQILASMCYFQHSSWTYLQTLFPLLPLLFIYIFIYLFMPLLSHIICYNTNQPNKTKTTPLRFGHLTSSIWTLQITCRFSFPFIHFLIISQNYNFISNKN